MKNQTQKQNSKNRICMYIQIEARGRSKKSIEIFLRNDEIKFLRSSEIAHAGMSYIGWLVSRHYIVPYTHFAQSPCTTNGTSKPDRRD